MKTYEEMTESILKQVGRYRERQAKRRKIATAVLAPIAGFCFVTVLGVGIMYAGRTDRTQKLTQNVIPAVTEQEEFTQITETQTVSSQPQPTTQPQTESVSVTREDRSVQQESAGQETEKSGTVQDEPEPQTEVPPTVTAQTEEEVLVEEKYVWTVATGAYADYEPGKVVEAEKVGEKICDVTVKAGWVYTDGSQNLNETLRAEIHAVTDIDSGTAVCVLFIDKGEALTTNHYYMLYNPYADESSATDYVIAQDWGNGTEE